MPGHGLVGMRERFQNYGGHVDVQTQPGGGFALTAFLPRVQVA
jgi:signal transduction histidine kinase